jgi:thiol:disulfide interchange protein
MAQTTDERSVCTMPKMLVLAAAVLLSARLIDIGISLRNGTPVPRAAVSWQIPPALATIPGANGKRGQSAPPLVPEFSPETRAEMEKLQARSAEQGKPLLYEFYADWSDPCKKMESTSLSNDQVRRVIDNRFLPIRIADRQKELGSNPRIITELQKKYRIFAFPTLVVVDAQGGTVATLVGNCSSLTTYRFLSRALHSTQ